ncbi:MAG TPA: adenylate/guanylate cyclase domain-containing protein, partial [Azonexus sp.]|nr:adenylate/guanylate cyclase domain-containing protein [Azonexus sp.]
MSQPAFLFALRNAGINPDDDAETRLKKSLLIFATGLVCLGSMLWLFLYGQMGPQFSATPPFIFQILLV